MAFDPTILSQIPDGAPNPIRQKETAFKLADLIDQQQLSRLKLNTAKAGQIDAAKAKDILKGADYSTPEGVTKTAEKLSRAGLPDQAMDFMKIMQGLQQGKGELQKQQYEMMAARNDIVGGAASALVGEFDSLSARVGSTQAAMMMQPKYQAAIQQLGGMKLPDGTPALGPEQLQQIQSNPQFNPDFLRTVAQRSKEGAAALKAQLEFHKEQTAEAKETETERHNRAMEDLGQQRVDKSGANFTPEMGALMAALAEKGVSLPTGFRSKEQQATLYKGLLDRNPGKSPDEIADAVKSGKLKLSAETKGAQTAGTQIGRVALAANELKTFGDQTLSASDAIPRGKFVPWNRLKQMADTKLSDPSLLRFKAKMQALENAYNQLAARSGTDVEKRAHIHELFNTANSPEAVKELVRALKEESVGAKEAADRTIAETSESSIPGTGSPASAAGGAVKPYDDAAKEARYQAWKKAHGG